MTGGNGNNIWGDSQYGNGKHRGREICADDMSDIYKFSDNEYDRISTIYIYTDSAYSDRVGDECEYIDRGDDNRGGELWE